METFVDKEINKATYKKPLKSKTSLRIKYEVQADRICQEIGDLERIRQRLSLSKRKICQLLLIDPSTWTRWTNYSGQKPPPHIYRMLQWYLLLEDKHPQMHADYWLRSYTNQTQDAGLIENNKRIALLENKLRRFERTIYVLGASLLFSLIFLGILVFI